MMKQADIRLSSSRLESSMVLIWWAILFPSTRGNYPFCAERGLTTSKSLQVCRLACVAQEHFDRRHQRLYAHPLAQELAVLDGLVQYVHNSSPSRPSDDPIQSVDACGTDNYSLLSAMGYNQVGYWTY